MDIAEPTENQTWRSVFECLQMQYHPLPFIEDVLSLFCILSGLLMFHPVSFIEGIHPLLQVLSASWCLLSFFLQG